MTDYKIDYTKHLNQAPKEEGLCWKREFIFFEGEWWCQEEIENRFRKRKTDIPEEIAFWNWEKITHNVASSEPEPEPEPEPAPVLVRQKKKRGRPRKAKAGK